MSKNGAITRATVVNRALEFFEGSRVAAMGWMASPAAHLDGCSPEQVARSASGCQRALAEIERLIDKERQLSS